MQDPSILTFLIHSCFINRWHFLIRWFPRYSYDPTTDSGIRWLRDHFGMSECQNEGYGEKVFQVGLEGM